jgi:hypothetical protein
VIVPPVAVRVVLLLLTLLEAGCGEDERSDTSGGPSPGTFVGTATDGSRVRLEVDRVEAFSFVCDGNLVRVTFDPRGRIHPGSDFTVRFAVGGRMLRMRRTFLDDDDVAGAVADEQHHCDLQFRARRATEPTATPSPDDTATHARFTTAAPVCTPSPPAARELV